MRRLLFIIVTVLTCMLHGYAQSDEMREVDIISIPEANISSVPDLEIILNNVLSDCKFIPAKDKKTHRTFFVTIGRQKYRDGDEIAVYLIGYDRELINRWEVDKINGYAKVGDDIFVIRDKIYNIKQKDDSNQRYYIVSNIDKKEEHDNIHAFWRYRIISNDKSNHRRINKEWVHVY